jgi:hypothetical protein
MKDADSYFRMKNRYRYWTQAPILQVGISKTKGKDRDISLN